MKYHIKNTISKKEIRKNGKKILPMELMKCGSKTLKELPTMRLNLSGISVDQLTLKK